MLMFKKLIIPQNFMLKGMIDPENFILSITRDYVLKQRKQIFINVTKI